MLRRALSATAAFALATGALAGVQIAAAPAAQAVAGAPFPATESFTFVSTGDPTQLTAARNTATRDTEYDNVGPVAPVRYNGIAYNTADNFLYGSVGGGGNEEFPQGTFIRIGQSGIEAVGNPIPESFFIAADFGPDGNYYGTTFGAPNELRVVDPSTGQIINTVLLSQQLIANDYAYAYGFFWANNGDQIQRIDPVTGASTTFTSGATPVGPYGAAWTYGNGALGFGNNDTGILYQVEVDNPTSDAPTFRQIYFTQGTPTTNNDGASSPGQPVDLGIVKTGPATAVVGQRVTWTLTITNNGPGVSSRALMTDPIPAGFTDISFDSPECLADAGETNTITCLGGRLEPGQSRTYNISATATADFTDEATNTATIRGDEEDPDPSNNSSDAEIAPASLSLEKSVTAVNDVNGNGINDAGDTIQYAFAVTNTGKVAVSGITIDDDRIAGATCAPTTLAPDAVANCTADSLYTINSGDVNNGEVVNTATASGTTTDDDATPVISNESSTQTPTQAPAPGLTLVKSVSPQGELVAGDEVTYTFLVTNTGNVTLTDITVREVSFSGAGQLSDVVCPTEAASLAPGDSVSCTATYRVVQADLDSRTLTNTASATGTPPSGPPTDSNESTVDIPGSLPQTGAQFPAMLPWVALTMLLLGAALVTVKLRRTNGTGTEL